MRWTLRLRVRKYSAARNPHNSGPTRVRGWSPGAESLKWTNPISCPDHVPTFYRHRGPSPRPALSVGGWWLRSDRRDSGNRRFLKYGSAVAGPLRDALEAGTPE